jgi:voltage-gated potassium channel
LENKWRIFVDILTAISVVAIIVDWLYPNLSIMQKNVIYAFDLFVVGILAIDFYNKLKKSDLSISKFLLRYWYEIPAMVPLILLSTLEHEFVIGAITRSIRLLSLFRIILLFFRIVTIFEQNRLMYIMIFAFASILLGAFAEYEIESPIQGTKINTFDDALWWAIATVTTVGYGDVYPVTATGRIIASILMIVGITILGLFISTLGESLIESRLSNINGQKIIKQNDNINIKNQRKNKSNNNNYNIIEEETKSLIKNKIDSIESLREDEFIALIKLLKAIYYRD